MNEPDPSAGPTDPSPQSGAPSGSPVDPPAPPSELDLLRAELEAARGKQRDAEGRLRAVSKAYQDLEADMDSFRKRMQGMADLRVEKKAGEVIEVFFEPVRNLRRSIEAGATDPAAVLSGLQMIREQFDHALHRLGVEEVAGVGAPFDPLLHEALAIAPVASKEQDGRVTLVYATGYRVGTKVLQPAQVVIGKFEAPAEA